MAPFHAMMACHKERAMFETIAEVSDTAIARVLVAALKAHGFHPLDSGDDGLPGFAGVIGPSGIPISVPENEAPDARVLAEDLLKEMLA
jgi:hypothetical protein